MILSFLPKKTSILQWHAHYYRLLQDGKKVVRKKNEQTRSTPRPDQKAINYGDLWSFSGQFLLFREKGLRAVLHISWKSPLRMVEALSRATDRWSCNSMLVWPTGRLRFPAPRLHPSRCRPNEMTWNGFFLRKVINILFGCNPLRSD